VYRAAAKGIVTGLKGNHMRHFCFGMGRGEMVQLGMPKNGALFLISYLYGHCR
jgi:hypothetical protein